MTGSLENSGLGLVERSACNVNRLTVNAYLEVHTYHASYKRAKHTRSISRHASHNFIFVNDGSIISW
jgi:hypothetical protein